MYLCHLKSSLTSQFSVAVMNYWTKWLLLISAQNLCRKNKDPGYTVILGNFPKHNSYNSTVYLSKCLWISSFCLSFSDVNVTQKYLKQYIIYNKRLWQRFKYLESVPIHNWIKCRKNCYFGEKNDVQTLTSIH